jgi:hypothetical protein
LKRPIKPTASPESDAYNPSESEAASPEGDAYDPSEPEVAPLETDAYGPSENEAAQSPRKKRATKAKLPIGQKAARNRRDESFLNSSIRKLKAWGAKKSASKTKIQPGQLIRGLQPLRLPKIALSPATINLNNSYGALSINPLTPFEHTSAEVRTVHVLETPIYKNRDFRLFDIALEVTTHEKLWKIKVWRIRVYDVNDSNDSHILQPLRIEANEVTCTKQ